MKKKALILLSGGLDSTTCLAIAKDQGFLTYALSFDYGQRLRSELTAAQKIAQLFEVEEHRIFNLGTNSLLGSALTDNQISVPTDEINEAIIPVTYVPARNTIFLAIALGWAEVLGLQDIFIGANAVDYSNYPDCRPEYIAAFENMANLATKAGLEGAKLKIHTPLIHLSKAEIIQTGLALGVDYSLTVSCYQANMKGEACRVCHSCQLRKRGFAEAHIADPTRYA